MRNIIYIIAALFFLAGLCGIGGGEYRLEGGIMILVGLILALLRQLDIIK